MLNKNEHSLSLLQGVEKIMDGFEAVETQYAGVIEEIEPTRPANIPMPGPGYHEHTIAFAPVNKSLDFYFYLRAVKDAGKGTTEYMVVFRPRNSTQNDEVAVAGGYEVTISRFTNWSEMIVGYNKVKLSKKERFIAESASQFYDYFESADNDAKTEPFNNDQQVFLYKLLDFLKQKVELSEGTDDEQAKALIEEIKLLQESVPVVTKATAVKGLSQIFAKMKAFSMKIFMDALDVAKKELIKAALYGGLHEIDTVIHHL